MPNGSAEAPVADEIESFMEILTMHGFSGAVLIAQMGAVVFEGGYGVSNENTGAPITADTVFDCGSLSKQFTAAAVLALEETGDLGVNDRLSHFFADVPSDKADITLHQLLTHSSGLPAYVYDGDFVETDRGQALQLAFAAELESPPGSRYLYSDTGYGLLAIVVEKVSGQPFQTFPL